MLIFAVSLALAYICPEGERKPASPVIELLSLTYQINNKDRYIKKKLQLKSNLLRKSPWS